MPEEKTVTVNIPLPAEVHRTLKVRAASEGKTLKDLLAELLAAAAVTYPQGGLPADRSADR